MPTYPPGPKSVLPVGQLFAFRRDPLAFLMRTTKTYGDLAHFTIGSQHYFLVNDPDIIKDVLVTHHSHFHKGRGLERARRMLGNGLLTSEDEFHHRQRRLAQPAFHRDRISRYAEVMVEYADQQQRNWAGGETLDVTREMMHLTLAIVGKTMFDTDTEAEAERVRQSVSASMASFNRIMVPGAAYLDRLPLPANRRFRRARAELDGIIYGMIDERRRHPSDRGDLISMMLASQDDEGDGGRMSNEQLRDEAITIFLAGHETTANALSWTWYLLSQHPAIEAKLHEEVDRVLGGRLPSAADFPNLQMTEMILAESMRIYPPAWILGRRAIKDYRLREYLVPAQAIVIMSPYVMHHDARYFPDPARFDPDRWSAEARASRPQFSYFPFGGGPRRCIGDGFAWMEGVMVLATLAQRWRFRLVPNQRIQMRPLITLRSKNGIRMILQERITRDSSS